MAAPGSAVSNLFSNIRQTCMDGTRRPACDVETQPCPERQKNTHGTLTRSILSRVLSVSGLTCLHVCVWWYYEEMSRSPTSCKNVPKLYFSKFMTSISSLPVLTRCMPHPWYTGASPHRRAIGTCPVYFGWSHPPLLRWDSIRYTSIFRQKSQAEPVAKCIGSQSWFSTARILRRGSKHVASKLTKHDTTRVPSTTKDTGRLPRLQSAPARARYVRRGTTPWAVLDLPNFDGSWPATTIFLVPRAPHTALVGVVRQLELLDTIDEFGLAYTPSPAVAEYGPLEAVEGEAVVLARGSASLF